MNIQGIIEKINKLRALSKSDNINEATAAAMAANKLIEQYRLSESELETKSEEILEDESPLYNCGRITLWRSFLAQIIANHYGCAIYNKVGHRSNQYMLIGLKSDMQIVKYMYAWLSLEIERLSHSAAKERLGNSNGKQFSQSFCLGATQGIKNQLASSRKECINENALVKIESRFSNAEAYMNKSLKLGKSKNSNVNISPEAYNNGFEKGKNIHLGAKLNEATRTKLLK